ncbi:hypothetical protein BJY01DRAFT_256155 [Aspergillus pseudoustus]|uniref:Uncharacterized protein n=1 Tax=Aspergillus pseudoustus TaxID=1810923 RepID=A0ABR4IF31_9EURO
MDEAQQPLAPHHHNDDDDDENDRPRPRSDMHTRIKTLISKALGKSPDAGKPYQVQAIPVTLSWISAAAVLGLSAFIVARAVPSWLRIAAIFNLILGVLGTLLTLGLDLHLPASKSHSDPRPSPASYIYVLAKGIIWLLAAAAMFITCATYDRSGSHFSKRKGGGGRGGGGRGSGGGAGPATPESVAFGCGFMDCLVVYAFFALPLQLLPFIIT